MNQSLLRLSICAAWALLLAAPLSIQAEPLRIGIAGDMSDRNPAAKALPYAVQFAIEDSRKSGLLSQEITTIVNDDQCKPDVATNIARKFADYDRVNLVIGHTCASTSLAASRVYQEKGLLLIDPTTTHPILTEELRNKKAPVFRIAERQDRAAAVAVIVLRDQIANKNICMVGDPFRKPWLDRFQALAANASKKFSVTDVIPDKGSGPDICVVYDPDNRSGLDKIGGRDDVIGVSGLDDRFPNPSTNVDQIKDLSKRLKAAGYSGPVSPAINAYAAVQIWAKAMQEVKSAETAKVAEQMRRLKFETVRGVVVFDEAGDVRQPLITIVRYSNPIIQVPNKCNESPCKDCKCDECCPK